jgi:hypothetical protein
VILAFADDGTVRVHAELEDVQRHCEGIDVEDGVYVFYDEAGGWLRPRFLEPNTRGRFSVGSGRFVLEPAPAPQDVIPIEIALARVSALDPNPWFADLDAVRAHVAARRRA